MSLANHVRYLERRLEGLVPESIHQRQIAAYAHAADVARSAASPREYLEQTNWLLELTRSEWIDRYETAARLYEALGDHVRARIARDNVAAAMWSATHGELVSAMVGAKLTSTTRRQGIENAAAKIPALLLNLVAYRLEQFDANRATRREELETLWREMGAGDPAIRPSSLRTFAPYRARIPFADEGVLLVIEWLEELSLDVAIGSALPESPAPLIDVPLSSELPSVDDVVAGYRAASAGIDADEPHLSALRDAYTQIEELASVAADGQELLASMAEHDVFVALARAPMIASCTLALESLAPEQTGARAHFTRLIDALEAARSVAEVEITQLSADEFLATEACWSQLVFCFALGAIAPTLAYEATPNDATRARARAAEEMTRALFGAGTAALLDTPAIAAVFKAEVFDRGQAISWDEQPESEVHLGEAFLDIAQHVRAAILDWGIAQLKEPGNQGHTVQEILATPRFETEETMRQHILSLLASVIEPSTTAPRPLQMWGQSLGVEHLEDTLLSPPRPSNWLVIGSEAEGSL